MRWCALSYGALARSARLCLPISCWLGGCSPAPCPRPQVCRKALFEAGKTGTFNTSAQFAPLTSTAGIADATPASLLEVAAGPLGDQPDFTPSNTTDEAASEEATALEVGATEEATALEVAATEAAAPAAAPSAEPAEGPVPPPPATTNATAAGQACNTTLLAALEAHKQFSTFRALIRTAGERRGPACCLPRWLPLLAACLPACLPTCSPLR